MPNTIETMAGFRNIAPADVPVLSKAFAASAKHHKWPRFYMSPLWLGSKSEYTWGWDEGCLCIMKRRCFYNQVVLYNVVAPMHPDGDLSAERAVLRKHYQDGVGARLSEEDLDLYRLHDRVVPDPGNLDYIYRAGDYRDLPGRRNRKWRNQWNELEGKCDVRHYDGDMTPALPAIRAIDKAWAAERDLSVRHYEKIATMAGAWAGTRGYTVSRDGVPCAYSISQRIKPGWVSLLVRLHDFGDALTDAGRAQQLLDAHSWRETDGDDALLNIGAATGIAGLAAAKEKMRPVKILQIYKLTPKKKPTREDYHATKPQPAAPAPGGFGLTN